MGTKPPADPLQAETESLITHIVISLDGLSDTLPQVPIRGRAAALVELEELDARLQRLVARVVK